MHSCPGVRSLLDWRARVPSYTPSLWSRRPPHDLHHLHLRRSLITWSPGFTSGDFILNSVTAGSGVLEIGARQLSNWRLHEPPDFLPLCQPGVPSTRLYSSLMPRHHFRLPGRYSLHYYCYHIIFLIFIN